MKLFELINLLEDLDCNPDTEIVVDRYSDLGFAGTIEIIKGVPRDGWVEKEWKDGYFAKKGEQIKDYVYITL